MNQCMKKGSTDKETDNLVVSTDQQVKDNIRS
jgi:hypothetical protein